MKMMLQMTDDSYTYAIGDSIVDDTKAIQYNLNKDLPLYLKNNKAIMSEQNPLDKIKNAVNEANSYAEAISMSNNKARYCSPQGHECKIIRATENSVTLLIYDNPQDPHEWTTNMDNFVKNYTLVS